MAGSRIITSGKRKKDRHIPTSAGISRKTESAPPNPKPFSNIPFTKVRVLNETASHTGSSSSSSNTKLREPNKVFRKDTETAASYTEVPRRSLSILSAAESIAANVGPRQDTQDGNYIKVKDEKKINVSGRVVTNDGITLKGYKVLILDKGVGRDGSIILGEGITNNSGEYSVLLSEDNLRKIGKEKADIKIEIVDSKDTSKVYGLSSLYYNVDKDLRVDLVLNNKDKIITKSSELEQLKSDIIDHAGKHISFKDLNENEIQQDISYLANKTAVDARLIAMISLAERYEKTNGIHADFFYALFRAGISPDVDQLYKTNAVKLRCIWDKAIEENIIEPSLKSKVEQNLVKFKECSTMHLLEKARPEGISSFKEFLDISLPSRAQQEEFVNMYYDHIADDPDVFWKNVDQKFGKELAQNLQLDGKLGYLTMNNASLITKLRSNNFVSMSPVDLIRGGLYKPENWNSIVDDTLDLPSDIAGETKEEKRRNYVNRLVFLLKTSYPTPVIAEMINNDEIRMPDNSVKREVYNFLYDAYEKENFQVGVQPISKILSRSRDYDSDAIHISSNSNENAENYVQIGRQASNQLERIQRIYQITPSDNAFKVLWENNLDSSYALTQMDEEDFVASFAEPLGGQEVASTVYNKALEVHSIVTNVALSYLIHRLNPRLYVTADLYETGTGGGAGGLIAQPTMEELFGSLDYCSCGHCESIFSPSHYLVALLQFLSPSARNRLLERRPDIQHLQLTCENTNTLLPQIDVGNEITEYYIVNNNSLKNFEGHNIEPGITSLELLASPQYVNDAAFTILRQQVYPFGLPFNNFLETSRLLFDHLNAKLYQCMETLRANESMDAIEDATKYGWRDIYNEFLNISPEEYMILTDSQHLKLPVYFGEPGNLTFESFNEKFSNAKYFSRKTDVKYNEIIEIVQTQTVNPNTGLITKFERLQISFADIQKFVKGDISDHDFDDLIASDIDEDSIILNYDGDIKQWVKNNYNKLTHIIVLASPKGSGEGETICGFDKLELKYVLPIATQSYDYGNDISSTITSLWIIESDSPQTYDHADLNEIDYWILMRFIKLWKKLGWTIEETDKLIASLYNSDYRPGLQDDINTQKQKLDKGFKDLIVKISLVKKIGDKLGLGQNKLLNLLPLWSSIDTFGNNSLYSRIFLKPSILKIDRVFEKNVFGGYLRDPSQVIADHLTGIQAALHISLDDLELILSDAHLDDNSVLSLVNISEIYRYSVLAKSLKISVEDLIRLKKISGINPFTQLENIHPSFLRFVELVYLIKESELDIAMLYHILRNTEAVGRILPALNDVLSTARIVREGTSRIELEHATDQHDPSGETIMAKMALIYENTVVDKFFGLLKKTISFSVSYAHHLEELEYQLKDISPNLTYDHLQRVLTYHGMMTERIKNDFIEAASGDEGLHSFSLAIQELYDKSQAEFVAFFDRYPDLKRLYDSYSALSNESTADEADEIIKMNEILDDFLPSLKRKLKTLLVQQTLNSTLSVDLETLKNLLENKNMLHSVANNEQPAIEDLLALEFCGVSAEYFSIDSSQPFRSENLNGEINFRNDDNTRLPTDTHDINHEISATWKFYLEIPTDEYYDIYIESDKSGQINLFINDQEVSLAKDESPPETSVHQNKESLELRPGRLYKVILKADKVKQTVVLKWAAKGLGREVIPKQYMYPYQYVEGFINTYTKILKTIAIAQRLGLSSKEIEYFSINPRFFIDEKSFLNKLPSQHSSLSVSDADSNIADSSIVVLFERFIDLMYYFRIKKSLNIDRDSDKIGNLIEFFNNPVAAGENDKNLFLKLISWDKASYDALLNRFGWNENDLIDIKNLHRFYDAFEILKKIDVNTGLFFSWLTNDPDQNQVNEMQNALRSKYDESDWLNIIQPISDNLRMRRRDALISHVIDRMQRNALTTHINSPERLFEYFLIDVNMDPCTKTSRIKQAISSVQLFITRWFMNLEKGLTPPSYSKKIQWDSMMERYRIYEAALKVYIHPEAFLDPQLRDNKSPFFRDLEGELFQSDITEQRAQTALLNYLEKLDEVSKLEICDIHLQKDEGGDILHVLGKTHGASRTYYYRRYEYGYWTPWEKVELDIEGEPVMLVVWKNRLLLFWLNIVRKGTDSAGGVDRPIDELDEGAREAIEINLSWSEYYNNKWQPRRTSDFDSPLKLLDKMPVSGAGSFKRTALVLKSWETNDGGLQITVAWYGFHPSISKNGSFLLYNTNSTPLLESGMGHFVSPKPGTTVRSFGSIDPSGRLVDDGRLHITYRSARTGKEKHQHKVLDKEKRKPRLIYDDPPYTDHTERPFFYENHMHVFSIMPEKRLIPIYLMHEIYFVNQSDIRRISLDPVTFTPLLIIPDGSRPGINGQNSTYTSHLMSMESVKEEPREKPRIIMNSDSDFVISESIVENSGTMFENTIIGPFGSSSSRARSTNRNLTSSGVV